MFSQIPVDLAKVKKEELNRVILRAAIIGELDAINLYEEMAALTNNEDIRKVMLDIAREEKAHVGEFQTLLLRLDQEQVQELEQGRKEVEELTGKKLDPGCLQRGGQVIQVLTSSRRLRVSAPGEQ
jgi:rubrerythrin